MNLTYFVIYLPEISWFPPSIFPNIHDFLGVFWGAGGGGGGGGVACLVRLCFYSIKKADTPFLECYVIVDEWRIYNLQIVVASIP